MNTKSKKKCITDKEEPTYDIRNVFPEITDEITIIGDIKQVLNQEQFIYLRENYRIIEYGYDGYTTHIKLGHLFTIDDVKKKIEEICKGE